MEQLLATRAPAAVTYDPLDLNPERYASGAWQAAFDGAPFDAFEKARFANPQNVDREGVVAFLESMAWFGELLEAERLALTEEMRSLLLAPAYHRPWETRVHSARRARRADA